MNSDSIRIIGARQHNLRGLDLQLPLNEMIVVTGVSGSGKSSLAFDTIYAEGQRRYVETFSPYARQFLDRMDRPQVDRVEGIPPAIAVDQTNPVRTSRSTVGTMTELNDHLKLLFAREATLYCHGCGKQVQRDDPQSIYRHLDAWFGGQRQRFLIGFRVPIPHNFSEAEMRDLLARQGYDRVTRQEEVLHVVRSRLVWSPDERQRVIEDLEAALTHGQGQLAVTAVNSSGEPQREARFSSDLHCPDCDLHYRAPSPNVFSFNSPLGACDACHGFGRVIGIDYDLVIPDPGKSLAEGAVKPWQSRSYRECQDDLVRFATRRAISTEIPWEALSAADREWVIEGEGSWDEGVWYGARRFFAWLESRSYRMHIRVLLSKYRSYRTCPSCAGARLKPAGLHWRLGPERLSIHDLMCLPIAQCRNYFDEFARDCAAGEATQLLLEEIGTRLRYLVDVGLGYLTLDRQSRTLSGGEVQRINLTTALGTSLVNTLFVLDEPSIGLHPRDINRLIGILHRLRDAGNTLLVVEHDPDVIRAADRVLDLGPGPGEAGGNAVYFGPLTGLQECRESRTGDYLAGRLQVSQASGVGELAESAPLLRIIGATAHNLQDLDVEIPLQRFVCVTGVSGSGKSTLIEDVCYRALRKLKHHPLDTPGEHREIVGHEQIDDVVLVDQTPIGKTTRSNPASYVKAFDAIRKRLAAEPLARERGYTAGTFSFNAGTGRCPSCQGNGFERVEMQFLSDVYLRCPDCDGSRYRDDVLDVKLFPSAGSTTARGHSVADILDMTISDACTFFADSPKVAGKLAPLEDVGLGYLRLGQPVPTLSGGEAQRLKLAGFLSKGGRRNRQGSLFLFDEPTTGLHFADIARLLEALRELLRRGHSIVVIEHNLDVIRAADWLIDLGPEGGEAGGRVVCAGPPAAVARCAASHTGAALREPPGRLLSVREEQLSGSNGAAEICIHRAREHNLKGVDVCIPRDRFTVITGISGSGKSTLAFDILFAEGQRRYLESLNAYARQFVQPASRPDVDAVFGIPPTVAIEQRTSRGGRKSTVATVTEVYHFLRLLFVKLGEQYCPDCDIRIDARTPAAVLARILKDWSGRQIHLLAPMVVARKGYYTDLAAWAAGKGFETLRVDGTMTPTAPWPRLDRYREHDIELPAGECRVDAGETAELSALLGRALDLGQGQVYVVPTDEPGAAPAAFSTRRACHSCGRSFAELDPRLFSYNSRHGWCPRCYGTGQLLKGFDESQTGEETQWTDWSDGRERVCPACGGRRLRPEALAVRFHGQSIAEYTALTVAAAHRRFSELGLEGREEKIARDLVPELVSRLGFLMEVGLPYLALDRSAPTLSGGEARRIRLAAQLGSNLRGVCYILDEPTIGLHARDNQMLLRTLQKLRRKGNTVVVVEHDEDTIRQADHVIDLGPQAGLAGGHVVGVGTVDELMANPESVTGRSLRTPLAHPLPDVERGGAPAADAEALTVVGADLHNLRSLDVRLPLNRLICVTGVSGSGKSTLVRNVVYENLRPRVGGRKRRRTPPPWRGCLEIRGGETLTRVLEVDQSPIGKTPRSCPATYVKIMDRIRKLFAETAEARMRGYEPGRFSFNVTEGRCNECGGQGWQRIEMSFLPDVTVLCEACGGRRFTPETLAIRYAGKSIADVLAMSVDEAVEFFTAHRAIRHALQLLQDVGLGYLTLGQPSPTLSGGEAQRIKLVAELAKARPRTPGARAQAYHTLYVLDEPTIGLHMADVEKLVRVLHRLVAAGNTLVVIEHNLDVIAEADWIVDMGPEGGADGGAVVTAGTPAKVARRRSHTARVLRDFLRQRKPSAAE